MTFLFFWVGIGLGHHITMAALNWKSFAHADAASIVRGLLGIPFWPITLIVVCKETP